MAIVDFSVIPIGTGTTSVSDAVASAHKVIADSGLPCRLNPMTTTVEGELDEILSLIAKIHSKLKEEGYQRLSTTIKIDDRFDRPAPRMEEKVRAVTEKLGKL